MVRVYATRQSNKSIARNGEGSKMRDRTSFEYCNIKWCKPLRNRMKKDEKEETLPSPSTGSAPSSVPVAIAGPNYHPPSTSSPAPSAGLQSPMPYKFKSPAEVKDYEKKGYYRSKIEYRSLYIRLTSEDSLKECMYSYSTQINEALLEYRRQ